MQKKKAQYSIYPLMLEGELKLVRHALGGSLPKNSTERDIVSYLANTFKDYTQGLNFQIFAEEHFWRTSGGHVIFPESAVVLDNLLKAKFQIESGEGFSLPFRTFSVAIPNGYTIDGVSVPSFLVTWIPYSETAKFTIGPFCDYLRLKHIPSVRLSPEGIDDNSIAISYRDPENTTAYTRALIGDGQIPALLAAKDLGEFARILGTYGDMPGLLDSSEADLKRQRAILQLVVALGIYNMATSGDRLLPGYPGGLEPRIIGRKPDVAMKNITLRNAASLKGEAAARDSFYRTWHFRQLRDERYYKGEYAKSPRGSRYVFVSDTVVGQKIDAYTQK